MAVRSSDWYGTSVRLAMMPSRPPPIVWNHCLAAARSHVYGDSATELLPARYFAANPSSAFRRSARGLSVYDLPFASTRRSNTTRVAGVSRESLRIRLLGGVGRRRRT